MTEQSTIDFLNNKVGTKLSLVSDTYSSYDAIDNNYIVEIKNRRAYYKDKMIEAMKLYKNYQASQYSNKQFLYVVTDEKGVWVFNISKNIKSIVTMPLKGMECPKTTDFKSNDKIIKYSYVLPESIAKHLNSV
tara:strand:- start:156 stop:554 length:399 start_codon:yes stop_codon:yes gene_type:complete